MWLRQLPLLDLPHRIARQRIEEANDPRTFVRGKQPGDVRLNRGRVARASRMQHHPRRDALTEIVVGFSGVPASDSYRAGARIRDSDGQLMTALKPQRFRSLPVSKQSR